MDDAYHLPPQLPSTGLQRTKITATAAQGGPCLARRPCTGQLPPLQAATAQTSPSPAQHSQGCGCCDQNAPPPPLARAAPCSPLAACPLPLTKEPSGSVDARLALCSKGAAPPALACIEYLLRSPASPAAGAAEAPTAGAADCSTATCTLSCCIACPWSST